MYYEVPGLGSKHQFFYVVIEGKPIIFTTESSKVRIQIQLLMTFVKSDGEKLGLEDVWIQVVQIGHSAVVADFSRSPGINTVSFTFFCICRNWIFSLCLTCDIGGGFYKVVDEFLTECMFCCRIFFIIVSSH